jgi:NAD(P)-dependent dehydrogenase (short-subunit alcohol dehydrogenase family)
VTLLQKFLDRLKGQTAWITGGKRVGHAVARILTEQGVDLVLSYRRSVAAAEEEAGAARALGVRATTVQADVSTEESVRQAVARVQAEFPRIDILVNMASVYRPVAIDRTGEADWRENLGAHVLGTFWPTQAIVPLMPRGGHVINIADVTSIGWPQKNNLPYVVTKAAVAAMTRAMALDYGDRGIFVNAIAPGPILPPDDFPREKWQRIRDRSPVKYPITDDEAVHQFALLVLYLSLTTAASGHTFPLDIGQNLY